MNKAFHGQRKKFIGDLQNAGGSESYAALSVIFLLSIVLVFCIYGFNDKFAYLAIVLLAIEVLLLIIDTSQLTVKFGKPQPANAKSDQEHIYGAVKLYTDILVIFTTILAALQA